MARSKKKVGRFNPDRFFFSAEPRRRLEGWYYQAREGTFGPFNTRDEAEVDLEKLKIRNPIHRREIFKRLGLTIRHFRH